MEKAKRERERERERENLRNKKEITPCVSLSFIDSSSFYVDDHIFKEKIVIIRTIYKAQLPDPKLASSDITAWFKKLSDGTYDIFPDEATTIYPNVIYSYFGTNLDIVAIKVESKSRVIKTSKRTGRFYIDEYEGDIPQYSLFKYSPVLWSLLNSKEVFDV